MPGHLGVSFLQQFNMIRRLKHLFQNKALRNLFVTCLLASLSYDTFYEFYPAYMTGLWHASTIQIAVYTAALSIAMAIGAGWLSHYLSRHISMKQTIIYGLAIISFSLILLALIPLPPLAMLLFIVVGLVIGVTTTVYMVQVSEFSSLAIQGEIFGTLWGMRMLLDGLISVMGGGMIMIAYTLPLIVAAISALVSGFLYHRSDIKISNPIESHL